MSGTFFGGIENHDQSQNKKVPDTFSALALTHFAADLLAGAGTAPDEAARVAESLVESNLRGHDSHGVLRVVEYVRQVQNGDIRPGQPLKVLHETPALLACDGGWGFGQVQCARLVDRLLPKADAVGIACGTINHCGHVGRLGEWVERAAARGYPAWMTVNDNGVAQFVAPPGGTRPRISTNPLAIGVPTTGGPLVLDMSTSAVANGKVKLARQSGQSCPPGWLLDEQGEPTTDPHVLLHDPPGTLMPFGGPQAYKGFGLGLFLDFLVGGLSGGLCPPALPEERECNNVLIVVWGPRPLGRSEHLLQQVDKLAAHVRDTPTRPGVEPIQLPGERGEALRRSRLVDGIPLERATWNALVNLADELHVAAP